jgi:DUF1680 family protein
MKKFAILVCIVAFFSSTVFAQPNPAVPSASKPQPTNTGAVNLAAVAVPSSSYVSGDTTTAAMNDGFTPRNSADNRRGSYGNWNRTGTQWVQYDWSRPISTSKMDVYWWNDNQGVRNPKACRVLFWDGNQFAPVVNPSGLGVAKDQYNATTFDEVTTTKLRLEIDSDGDYSTGILEWKVYDSGKSPDFPPSVTAGIDRTVVLGAKTWLTGTLKTLKPAAQTKVIWNKESGPGTVSFENANAPATTAQFSAPGEYVLKLTAGEGQLSGSSTLNITAIAPAPETHFQPIRTKHYTIDSPLWNGRIKALIVNWIPHCIAKINDPALKEGGINNFLDAANKLQGKPFERHRGYVFSNAWVHNTIEAICIAEMIDAKGDPEILKAQQDMKATLEDWIPKVLAAQEPDGYLHTSYTLGGQKRWSNRGDHEGYTAGYFLEAAIAHHVLTDGADLRLYNAAKKLADCWDNNLGPAPKKYWYDGHQAMEMALVRFGRFVNEVEGAGKGDKYITLAKFLLDCRKDGGEYDQSHRPVTQQYEAVGHAVRAVYSYTGMSYIAIETGDLDYQSAVMSLWDNMINKKYYVTGGVGSGETSEGFGPNYSLRQSGYCEACSSCGEVFFQHNLNLMWQDARYADLAEETLYNALLGSIDLQGKNFYYDNALDSHGSRYDWHVCPCCVGNIPRTLMMLPTWMYARSDDGIVISQFVGSKVTVENIAGTTVEMVQATDYPWNGKVSITVNPAAEKNFTVRIRVPDRSVSELYTPAPESNGIASIAVNGSAVTPKIENGYAVIARTWKAGDKIELVLPMKVQRIKADDKVAATRGRVALQYGPMIYCVEKADQELGKVLSPDSALTTEWKADLLDGVMVIKGTWADGSPLTAIPYYIRDNRNTAEPRSRSLNSTVWLKDR